MTNEEFIGKTPTPEALIRLSLKYLEEVRMSSEYFVNMSHWITYGLIVNQCGLSWGALTLVFGLDFKPNEIRTNHLARTVPLKVRHRVKALDTLCRGDAHKAVINYLGCWRPNKKDKGGKLFKDIGIRFVHHYDSSPDKFKRDMYRLADKLEEYELLINTARAKPWL